MRALRFDEPASQAAFDHLVSAYSVRDAQLAAIDKQIAEAALSDPLADAVARLRAFRGIDTLSAVTILTETCDFHRFATAASYMAFTGRALGALQRGIAAPRVDHQDRQRACTARARGGRLGLPAPSRRTRRARKAPRAPAT